MAKPNLMNEINKILNSMTVKAADEVGNTTHPSDDVKDNTQPSSEGARSAENTKDVKKTFPTAVDNTKTDIAAGDNSPNIGVEQSLTGEAPAIEDNYKDRPIDPGTSTPASASYGEKYASMSFTDMCKVASDLGNSILADIATSATQSTPVAPATKTAADACTHNYQSGKCSKCGNAESVKTAAETPATPTPDPKAALAGQELAASLLTQKQANWRDMIVTAALEGAHQAELVAQFYQGHAAQAAKQAEDDGNKPSETPADKPPTQGPPPDAGDGSETAPGNGADLLGQLGGGGAPPVAPPPPAGDPTMGGGDPMAGGGGGGGTDQASLENLAAVLDELGMTPEDLLNLLTQKTASALVKIKAAGAQKKAKDMRTILKEHIQDIAKRQ